MAGDVAIAAGLRVALTGGRYLAPDATLGLGTFSLRGITDSSGASIRSDRRVTGLGTAAPTLCHYFGTPLRAARPFTPGWRWYCRSAATSTFSRPRIQGRPRDRARPDRPEQALHRLYGGRTPAPEKPRPPDAGGWTHQRRQPGLRLQRTDGDDAFLVSPGRPWRTLMGEPGAPAASGCGNDQPQDRGIGDVRVRQVAMGRAGRPLEGDSTRVFEDVRHHA